jgi:hypothetical protein
MDMDFQEPLSIETLREILAYDGETGNLTWLPRPRKYFVSDRGYNSWNAKWPGAVALNVKHRDGYKQGQIFAKSYLAHRVAYALATGAWPDAEIDHVNGDPADNRLCNLRAATRVQNSVNRKRRSNGSSHFKGVTWHKQRKKWAVSCNGKHIGLYECENDAALAYNAAAQRKYGDYVRSNVGA